jgi:hypothetical protein
VHAYHRLAIAWAVVEHERSDAAGGEHATGCAVELLRAGVLGVQARSRAGDTEDAITLLDGLRALLGRGEH